MGSPVLGAGGVGGWQGPWLCVAPHSGPHRSPRKQHVSSAGCPGLGRAVTGQSRGFAAEGGVPSGPRAVSPLGSVPSETARPGSWHEPHGAISRCRSRVGAPRGRGALPWALGGWGAFLSGLQPSPAEVNSEWAFLCAVR